MTRRFTEYELMKKYGFNKNKLTLKDKITGAIAVAVIVISVALILT